MRDREMVALLLEAVDRYVKRKSEVYSIVRELPKIVDENDYE